MDRRGAKFEPQATARAAAFTATRFRVAECFGWGPAHCGAEGYRTEATVSLSSLRTTTTSILSPAKAGGSSMLGILPHAVQRKGFDVEPFGRDLRAFRGLSFPAPGGEQPAGHVPLRPEGKMNSTTPMGQVCLRTTTPASSQTARTTASASLSPTSTRPPRPTQLPVPKPVLFRPSSTSVPFPASRSRKQRATGVRSMCSTVLSYRCCMVFVKPSRQPGLRLPAGYGVSHWMPLVANSLSMEREEIPGGRGDVIHAARACAL